MSTENRWTNKVGRWLFRTGKKLVKYLISIVVSLLIMVIIVDSFAIFSGRDTAREIATRAAVAAGQVMEQGGDRSLAKEQAAMESERNLADFQGIDFPDKTVVVTITFRPRSMILKYVPWAKQFTTITTSGSHSYE